MYEVLGLVGFAGLSGVRGLGCASSCRFPLPSLGFESPHGMKSWRTIRVTGRAEYCRTRTMSRHDGEGSRQLRSLEPGSEVPCPRHRVFLQLQVP